MDDIDIRNIDYALIEKRASELRAQALKDGLKRLGMSFRRMAARLKGEIAPAAGRRMAG